MAYYKKVLQPDETVLYFGRLHWLIYKLAIVLGLAALGLFIAAGMRDQQDVMVLLILGFVCLLLAVISFIRAWFRRMTTEMVVTNKRLIYKVGFIARHTQEINITKVETVDVAQGLGGRLFGYGTVLIKGTGGSWEPLRGIASPLQMRNAIIVG